METPLRLRDQQFHYYQDTPLQLAGWSWADFGRCNTVCAKCYTENGVLLCAAKPPTLEHLGSAQRVPPIRIAAPSRKVRWVADTSRAIVAVADKKKRAQLRDIYAWFNEEFPFITTKPTWQAKIRINVQKVGKNTARGVWQLKPAYYEKLKTLLP
jgi:hypothetical protein